jgi:parallel beta-helix repeat protein
MKMRLTNFIATSLTLLIFPASASVFYVNVSNTIPASPFTNWPTAATNIQDAIDASNDGDLVLVTNGVYATGGRVVYGSLTNRVVINKAVTVQSVNGPEITVIQGNPSVGDNAVRCVYMTNNAILIGFTLTNGATLSFSGAADLLHLQTGGGVFCESTSTGFLSNCVISGSSAFHYGGGGSYGTYDNCIFLTNRVNSGSAGGCFYCTLNNCVLIGNFAGSDGGGADYCTLNNCKLYGNFAIHGDGGGAIRSTLNNCLLLTNTDLLGFGGGGGACQSTLNNCLLFSNSGTRGGGASSSALINCTVVGNSAQYSGGGTYLGSAKNCVVYGNACTSGSNYSGGTFSYTCIAPLMNGFGNISNAPVFVDPVNGDLHLQSNSPCINSGYNAYVSGTNDLDGNPRIVGGTVDIGAYEYQSPSSILSYAWAQQFSLPTDGTADKADPDGDGMSNYSEFKAGTNPTNALSVLQMFPPVLTKDSHGTAVIWGKWRSVGGIIYCVERSSGLTTAFSCIQSNILGQASTNSFVDPMPTNGGSYFYRVGVQ